MKSGGRARTTRPEIVHGTQGTDISTMSTSFNPGLGRRTKSCRWCQLRKGPLELLERARHEPHEPCLGFLNPFPG